MMSSRPRWNWPRYRYFPPGTIFLAVVDRASDQLDADRVAEAGDTVRGTRQRRLTRTDDPPAKKWSWSGAMPVHRQPDIRGTRSVRLRGRPLAKGNGASAGPPGERLEFPRRRSAASLDGEVPSSFRQRSRTSIGGSRSRPAARWRSASAIVRCHASCRLTPAAVVTALFGSSDHLELALNGGSASAALAAGRGARVHVARSA
jgi:hypothetical protein